MRPGLARLGLGAAMCVAVACDGDAAAPPACDVLLDDCATSIAGLTAELYGLPWPRGTAVAVIVPGGGSASSSSDAAAEAPVTWSDLDLEDWVDELPHPADDVFGDWSGGGGSLDASLAEGLTPSGIGSLDEVPGEPWVTFTVGASWAGDDPDLARRRLAGLVANAASFVRHEASPAHAIDRSAWSEAHGLARWGYRLGVGRLLLHEVERALDGEAAPGGWDAAALTAELDALVSSAWDADHTPGRHPVSDLARYAGMRAVADRVATSGAWRAADDALAVYPGPCLRELVWPGTPTCVVLQVPVDPELDALAPRVGARQISASQLALWLQAQLPTEEEGRDVARRLAGHVGLLRLQLDEAAVIAGDVLRFDDTEAAGAAAEAFEAHPDVAAVAVEGADVRVVSGSVGDLADALLAQLAAATLLDDPPGFSP